MDCVQPLVGLSASTIVFALFYKQAQNRSSLQYTIGVILACCILSIILGGISALQGNCDASSSYKSKQRN